jgi:hypothetical protein
MKNEGSEFGGKGRRKGFRGHSLGFGVQGLGVLGLGIGAQGVGFQGVGCRVLGLGFEVWG